MSKTNAAVAALVTTLLAAGSAHAGNYLDDIARLDAQIAIQRKQIEARDLAIHAAGRVSLPTVRYVSGFEDDLSAVLSYGNGRKITVKRGDHLPGGIEVKGVRQNGVLVAVGKQVEVLEFAVAENGMPGVQQQQQQQQASGLMPPLPQVNVPLPSNVSTAQQVQQLPQPQAVASKPATAQPASVAPVAAPSAATPAAAVQAAPRAAAVTPAAKSQAPAAGPAAGPSAAPAANAVTPVVMARPSVSTN